MPLTSSIPRQPLQRDLEPPPREFDPQAAWLLILSVGAGIGAFGAVVSAGWSLTQILSRTQGTPPRLVIGHLFPYLTLGISAMNWITAWLLTSRSPIYDPVADREWSGRFVRYRAGFLRLLVTGGFFLWSLQLFGLLTETLRPNSFQTGFWLTVQSSEAAIILLLWTHLRAVAQQLQLPGLQGRSILVLLGRGGTVTCMGVGPTLFAFLNDRELSITRDFANLRDALFVFWAVIAAMVFVRFSSVLYGRAKV